MAGLFDAVARKGSTQTDQQSGSVEVSETNLEYVDTRRNDDLLSWIAVQTGGTFITHSETARLPQILRDLDIMEAVTTDYTTDTPLYQSPIWFIILLILLTAEWIIRKSSALA